MNNKKFWISLIAGIMAVAMLLTLILSILPAFADAAQSSSAIKEQIAQMEKENQQVQAELDALKDQLSDLNAQQDANKAEITKLLEEKDLIDQQVGLLYTQIANINEQIAAYNVLVADKQEELEEAEKKLDELNAKYKERIRAMEEDGDLSYWSVLFEASSFTDLLDRLNMIQEIAASDSKRLEELRTAAQAVQNAQEELMAERAALELVKEELATTQSEFLLKSTEAEALLSELTVIMEELKAEEDKYQELVGKMEDELEELEIAIGKAENDLDEALYREYLATMTTATTAPTTSGSTIKSAGYTVVDESGIAWVVPCTYLWVSSAFGWRWHPVYGDYRFHNGVDLAAACKMKSNGTTDSPILATRAGVVVTSTYSSTAGWYVTIDHLDGYRSTYMHMCCKPFVKVGDVVAAGQSIGCIGTTGSSTGNHLHFGIYKNGNSVNPMDYIG